MFVEIISIVSCIEVSWYVKVRLSVDFSPFLTVTRSVSTSTEIGKAFAVSITPILFSAHSVNQILSFMISKPNTCATPQSAESGIKYSTRDSFCVSKMLVDSV